MNTINILDTITKSDTVFYVLVIVLIILSISTLYLIWMQYRTNQRIIEKEDNKDFFNSIVEESREEHKPLEVKEESFFNYIEEEKKEPIIELTREERIEPLIELPRENKNFPKETLDLQTITRELETLPREVNIKMTPYEEEQEEKAIISYDELVKENNNASIAYSDTVVKDDIVVKQVDLENTGKIELDPIKKELNTKVNVWSYEHEEAFLEALKQLKNILN